MSMSKRLEPTPQGEDTVVTPPGKTPPKFDLKTFLDGQMERVKKVEKQVAETEVKK